MNDPCVRFKKLENKMNHMRGCSATMHVHARDRGNVTVPRPQALLMCSSTPVSSQGRISLLATANLSWAPLLQIAVDSPSGDFARPSM